MLCCTSVSSGHIVGTSLFHCSYQCFLLFQNSSHYAGDDCRMCCNVYISLFCLNVQLLKKLDIVPTGGGYGQRQNIKKNVSDFNLYNMLHCWRAQICDIIQLQTCWLSSSRRRHTDTHHFLLTWPLTCREEEAKRTRSLWGQQKKENNNKCKQNNEGLILCIYLFFYGVDMFPSDIPVFLYGEKSSTEDFKLPKVKNMEVNIVSKSFFLLLLSFIQCMLRKSPSVNPSRNTLT